MSCIDWRGSRIAGDKDIRAILGLQEAIDCDTSEAVVRTRHRGGQRMRPHAGAPDYRGGGDLLAGRQTSTSFRHRCDRDPRSGLDR